MNIALVGSSLRAGGAERVLASLANRWSARHGVYVVTIHGIEEDFYRLSPEVHRIGLNEAGLSPWLGFAILANARRVAKLRACLIENDIDVVISFHTRVNVLSIIAARLARIPIVVSERIDRMAFPENWKWRAMQALTYRVADSLVVQTECAREAFRGVLPENKITTIPNPLGDTETSPHCDGAVRALHDEYIVAVGRLVPQKGFDLLIDAFAKLAERFAVDLVVAGDGPDRDALLGRAQRLGVANRVHFLGLISNPRDVIARAKMLVVASRFEGFPNVLLEAMSVGTPVVATDCRSGPRDIVQHGVNGLLVAPENSAALAEAMEALLIDETKRLQLAAAAKDSIRRFDLETIAARWEALLASVRTRA